MPSFVSFLSDASQSIRKLLHGNRDRVQDGQILVGASSREVAVHPTFSARSAANVTDSCERSTKATWSPPDSMKRYPGRGGLSIPKTRYFWGNSRK